MLILVTDCYKSRNSDKIARRLRDYVTYWSAKNPWIYRPHLKYIRWQKMLRVRHHPLSPTAKYGILPRYWTSHCSIHDLIDRFALNFISCWYLALRQYTLRKHRMIEHGLAPFHPRPSTVYSPATRYHTARYDRCIAYIISPLWHFPTPYHVGLLTIVTLSILNGAPFLSAALLYNPNISRFDNVHW